MLTIGLTGGIGSGKSVVAKMLAELGATVLDADKVGHEIYSPGARAYDEVVATFGKKILAPDGTIERKLLGPVVFADPAALKRLNAIVHPKMFERMREMVVEIREGGDKSPIVIEAAILIEANWGLLFDEIWLVTASRDNVIHRIERDRGLKPEQTETRIRAQLPDDERRKHATLVIENNGTLDDLRARVAEIWRAALARNAKS
jgi:dephospho-CoA kinase